MCAAHTLHCEFICYYILAQYSDNQTPAENEEWKRGKNWKYDKFELILYFVLLSLSFSLFFMNSVAVDDDHDEG